MQKTKQTSTFAIFFPQTFHLDIPLSLDECVARIKYSIPRKRDHSNDVDISYVPIHPRAIKLHMRKTLWLNFEVELLAQLDQLDEKNTIVNGIARIPNSTYILIVLHLLTIIAPLFVLTTWDHFWPIGLALIVYALWPGFTLYNAMRCLKARHTLVARLKRILEN